MKRIYVFIALGLFVVTAASARADKKVTYKIIVNRKNPVTSLSRDQVSDFFMKKKTVWQHGAVVAPVDLRANSPVRAVFSKNIHGKSTKQIVAYWERLTFSGRGRSPSQKRSDRGAVAYVQAVPGAIGYVSGDYPVGGTRVLEIR